MAAPAGAAPGAQEVTRSVVYFAIFGSLGMSTPFIPVLLSTVVTPAQVGVLSAIQPIVSVFAGPAAAALADQYLLHRAIMVGSTLLGSLLLPPLLYAGLGFQGFFVVLLLSALVGGKSTTLLDASTVDAVGTRYGSIRLWGAIGFGITALVGGALIGTEGEGCEGPGCFQLALLGAAAIGVVAGLLLLRISVEGLQAAQKAEGEGTKTASKWLELRPLLCSWRVGSFVLIVFFSGVASGMIDNYLYIHLAELGGSGTLMGLARFITCAAEVPFFRMADSLLARFGVMGVLSIAQLAYVVRHVWYTQLQRDSLWLVLPCEVLHGLTFAALWTACTCHAATLAPPTLKATLQGVVGGVHWGLGVGTGAVLGGALFGSFGGVWMFAIGACISSVSLALALAACRQWPGPPAEETKGDCVGEGDGTGEVARLLPRDDE